MTTATASTKDPQPTDLNPPPPAGIPLWPVTLIAGEVVTILGSVGWAAAGPFGVLAGIGGLTAACVAAAAGTRYRRASSARRAAAAGVDGGSPGAGGRRRSSGLPGVSAGRGARSALGRSSSGGGGGGPRAGRTGGAASGKKPSRLAGLLGGRRPGGKTSGAGDGSSGRGAFGSKRGRGSGAPKLGLFRKLKPTGAGTGAGARGGKGSTPAKDGTATSKRRPFWRGLAPKSGPKARVDGHSSRKPWQLTPKKGSRLKPNKPVPPIGGGPKTGDTIRGGTEPNLIKPLAPVPPAAPAPKVTAQRPSATPRTPANSRGGSTTGGTMRSRLGFSELTQQCVTNAQKWQVGKGEMTPAANEMARELEAGIANMAKALSILGSKMQAEQPLSPVLASIAKGGAQGLARIAGMTGQWGAVFQKVHAPDVQRQVAPRPNEQAWNAGRKS